MAIVWYDGFETQSIVRWTTSGTAPTVSSTQKKGLSTRSLYCNASASTSLVYISGWNNQASFWLYIDTMPAANCTIAGSVDADDTIVLGTDGYLRLYKGASLLGTGGTHLDTGVWYRISFAGNVGVGTAAKLWVNGVQQVSVASGATGSIGWDFGIETSTTAKFYFDDYVVGNATDLSDLGDRRVLLSKPNAAGDLTQFTPSSGSNYACVDDIPPAATPYVSHAATAEDLYHIQDSATIGLAAADTINVVAVWLWAYRTGTSTFAFQVKDNGTDNATTQALTTGAAWYYKLYATMPTGGGAWTQARFDALQMGGKVSAGTARIQDEYAMVLYTPAAATSYKDITTRFEMTVQGFKDVATRFKLTQADTAYKDAATRFKLNAAGFRDVATRFKLTVLALKDIPTRFRLTASAFKDATARFKVTIRAYRDISARFRLRTTSYMEVATRLRLTVQALKDIGTRFKLTAQSFKDVVTRFRLLSSTVDIDIATGNDDGMYVAGTPTPWFDNSSSWYEAGNDPFGDGTNVAHAFFRFQVGAGRIPAGAVITSAYLRTVQNEWDAGTHLKIRADDQASSPQMASYADGIGRARTSAAVDWDSGFSDFDWHNSPDFKTVIQELVDSYGETLDTIQVLVDDDGSDSKKYHVGATYETGNVPRLHIQFGIPAYRDIPTRFKIWVSGFKDIVVRFRLTVQGFKDTFTRFRLTVQSLKDITTRFKLMATAWKDVSSRFKMTVQGFRDTATRFVLIQAVSAYKDAATRFKLTVRNFADVSARFKVWSTSFRDVTARFKLMGTAHNDVASRFRVAIRGFKDVGARFRLRAIAYVDVTTRFRLGVRSFKDTAARFRLRATAYKDVVTRFRMNVRSFRDVAVRFKLTVQKFTDVATRFKVSVLSFKNVSTRFRLTVQKFKDIGTRFRLRATAYADVVARFKLIVPGFRDVATRFKLRATAYLSVATRFRIAVRAYTNIATRFKLTILNYRDIVTRYTLAVRNFQDMATRFALQVRGYRDVATRFRLTIRNYVDVATRFRLVVQSFADVPGKFRLTVQTFRDIPGRFKVIVQGYHDVTARFSVSVFSFKDAAARFKLSAQAFRDVTTRFKLTVRSYFDVPGRFTLNAGNYQDASCRFSLRVAVAAPVIGGWHVIQVVEGERR